MEQPFSSALRADFGSGKMYWIKPPSNHPELMGKEAGFIVGGNGNNKRYWQIRVFGQQFKRSRLMFFMAHGRWPAPYVDHINGDSLDDRLTNLRDATPSQNTANSKSVPRQMPLPRGVYKTKYGYLVRVTCNGETLNLGTFDSLEFATGWAEVSRREVFGEYARS